MMSEISIPGFEIIELIGRGGMASVWKARQLSLDRIVAIKVLSARFVTNSSDIDRFQAEARAAAQLKHQGIVQVYDTGSSEGLHYIVMEYVDGYTVGTWLRRKEVLSEADALLVAECVADALDHAWKKAGLIHCDIKPDNVIVDADGTVKVADLGLSRSLISMSVEEESDEILGTPAYISPEQARGDTDLDCRADIYSVGAMLFNLVTGRRLFKGLPEDEVMEQQCVGMDSNPCDINKTLSPGVGILIEKMLAKDKRFREKDWEAVKADIRRVKHRHSPHGRLPEEAESTVDACKVVSVKRHSKAGIAMKTMKRLRRENHSATKPILVLGAVLIVAIIAAIFIRSESAKPMEPISPPLPPSGGSSINVVEEDTPEEAVHGAAVPDDDATRMRAERRAASALEAVETWMLGHPDDHQRTIEMFEKILPGVEGTSVETVVREHLSQRRKLQQADIELVMHELEERAGAFVNDNLFKKAALVYENYDGEYASATEERRMEAALSIREQARAAKEAATTELQLGEQNFQALMSKVAKCLISGDTLQALSDVSEVLDNGGISGKRKELNVLKKLLTAVMKVDSRILESFKAQIGKTVRVELSGGAALLSIIDVEGKYVSCKRKVSSSLASASREMRIEVDDLATRERLVRMGSDSIPEVALEKSLMAIRSRAFTYAEKYLANVPAPLREALLKEIKGNSNSEVHGRDGSSSSNNGRSTDTPVHIRERPERPLPIEFRSVENDLNGVIALLQKKNPGLTSEGIAVVKGDDGKVSELTITSDRLKDIEPVMALRNLRSLRCIPENYGIRALKSIRCLRGMNLTQLVIQKCPVSDISALRSMPLVSLDISDTQVRDLSPLRGIGLKNLDLSRTGILDVRALRRMPLETLKLDGTDVRRLNELTESPLQSLSVRGCKQARDFSWLKGMKLSYLDLNGTSFDKVSILAGMPLVHLDLGSTGISGLSGLDVMKLESLNISNTDVRDFAVLTSLQLKKLYLDGTTVKDLGCLDTASLKGLSISSTGVSDISPLKGAKLEYLNIENTAVSGIGVLADMPLNTLNCRRTKVRDITPLRSTPIRKLWLDSPTEYLSSLGLIHSLAYINGTPRGDYF